MFKVANFHCRTKGCSWSAILYKHPAVRAVQKLPAICWMWLERSWWRVTSWLIRILLLISSCSGAGTRVSTWSDSSAVDLVRCITFQIVWVEHCSRTTWLNNGSSMPAIQESSAVVSIWEESSFSGWTFCVVLSFGFLCDENIRVFISEIVESFPLHDIRLPSKMITLLVVLIKSFWYLWVTMKFLRFHTIRWITDLFQNYTHEIIYLVRVSQENIWFCGFVYSFFLVYYLT